MNNVVILLLRRLRTPLVFLILVYAVSVLGFTLIPGMDDQGRPWRMDFFHAFYFVSYMATTIGFGELPYPFTGAQRLWATATIYSTVTAWLYAIGTLLAVVQDPAFRAATRENRFRRAVRRITEPFYIICGYGDTGSLLARALADEGIRSVVVDIDAERISALTLDALHLYVPGLCADAAVPEVLKMAGLGHRRCLGVVGLTRYDHVNLKIAITTRLLRPRLATIARAETRDAEANMASFGTDHIINPFDTFAGRLARAVHAPGIYLLYEWMTGVPHERLGEPVYPPTGRWVLCGYGRFGKAVHARFSGEGVRCTIIEADPENTAPPPDAVAGRGTEAETLREAGIEDAVGIVAGTDDDANNLSIVMTARELNPGLFMVARQNLGENELIFRAAKLDLVMQRGSIIAHKIFALLTTPLLGEFLAQARNRGNEWANQLVSRISGILGDEAPNKWLTTLDAVASPAVASGLDRGATVRLGDLLRDPRNRDDRLDAIALMLKRGDEEILVPDDDTVLQPNDRILWCGGYRVRKQMDWVCKNHNVFGYILTGKEQASGYLWQWLFSR